jgi:hypothetical protein
MTQRRIPCRYTCNISVAVTTEMDNTIKELANKVTEKKEYLSKGAMVRALIEEGLEHFDCDTFVHPDERE